MVHLQATTLRDEDTLEALGMTARFRSAMALPYNRIIEAFPQGLPITIKEAGDLVTVGGSVDLVTNRANGK